MKWDVYIENINKRKIGIYNIFDHASFLRECAQAVGNYPDKSEFAMVVQKWLRYFFGHKCEWEIILSDFPPSKKFEEKKIDVCQQVMLNFSVFIDYVWENRDELVEQYKDWERKYL